VSAELGVAVGDRWLPAAAILPDGPRTMEELLAGGPLLVDRLAAAVPGAGVA
jgi:hypothetical protein